MGLFDSICEESGLIIDSKQRLVLVAERAKGEWAPIALPIAGTNDRGGTMDKPKTDANVKAILAFGKTLEYSDVDAKKLGFNEMLDELRGDNNNAIWNKRRVSFSLFDDGVYRAIVGAVAESGATAWKRFAQLGLRKPEPQLPNRKPIKHAKVSVDATTKRLCEAILATPTDKAAQKVYVDHLLERDDPHGKLLALLPALRKLKFDAIAAVVMPDGITYSAADKTALVDAMREFAMFVAWRPRFGMACGEGQFVGYTDGEYGGGVEPYCTAARKKYAGMPELLAAVAANEKVWRERDDEGEDDDNDDDDD